MAQPADEASTKDSGADAAERRQSVVVEKLAKLEHQLNASDEPASKVPWIKTPMADSIFGFVIFLNAAFIGVDIEFGTDDFNPGLFACESIFLVIFSVEIILRLAAEHPYYWRFFNCWGIFDVFLTVTGLIDGIIMVATVGSGGGESPLESFTVLRMFRLVRLVRLIRVLRMFSELVILVQTIANSMKAVAWMSLLLGMIVYTGSVLTMMLVGLPYRETDEEVAKHFGSLGSAVFSHFCVVTLEGWPDVAMAAINTNRLWGFYFIFMIILTNFALLNLMVGVIVEQIMNASRDQENDLASFVAESDQFRRTLQTLFDSFDMDASGGISKKEVRRLLDDPRTHEIMDAFGINLNVPAETLHLIMDVNCDGETTFEEFFDACIRMCGSKQNIHSVFIQGDVCNVQREVKQSFAKLEESLGRLGSPTQLAAGKTSRPFTAAAAGVPFQVPATSEAAVMELLERMDRFGQVQQTIFAEVTALKEHAKMAREQSPGDVLQAASMADVGPVLLQKAGTELGECCLESLFSHRRAPIGAAARSKSAGATMSASPAGASGLRERTRRELQAEFNSKRAAR